MSAGFWLRINSDENFVKLAKVLFVPIFFKKKIGAKLKMVGGDGVPV